MAVDNVLMMNFSYNSLAEFSTLFFLEIILGVDNLVFIALVTSKLPGSLRNNARTCGISLALVMRFAMLFGASILASMDEQLIPLRYVQLSYREAFFLAGGGLLIYKSMKEMYLEIALSKACAAVGTPSSFLSVIWQVVFIDIILSLDSVVSAVGITDNVLLVGVVFFIYAMIALFLSKEVSEIVKKNENIKIIALLFMGALGALLFLDGLGIKISHNYLYSTVLFPAIIEAVNELKKKRRLSGPKKE
ncbi:MAG: TerC family protein [Anaplasma sp.]